VHRNVIPFNVFNRPVFDGDRFLYVQQNSFDGNSRRFGCVDVETMVFEELPEAPRSFGWVNSFFHDGAVFAFDYGGRGMKYDVKQGVWSDASPINAENGSDARCCFIEHPWDDSLVIYLAANGSVRVVRIEDGAVVKQFQSCYDGPNNRPEAVAVKAPHGEFHLLVCYGCNNCPWRVFSSATDTWTDLQWPSTGNNSSNAVFDPETMQLFYHIKGQDKWTTVKLGT
jgi:hypothetical protein